MTNPQTDSQGITPEAVAAFHERADTDSGPYAKHHTLGINQGQAADGAHIHDGKSGKLLSGLAAPPSVTGSRGGNVALANLLTALANENLIINNTTP